MKYSLISFLVHVLRLRCPPWKAWNWWNLLKAHIGHMDNRGRIQTSRKCFERENRHWPYQRSSTYSTILFFPVESTEKGLRVFHDSNQNFRFPFLKTETPTLYLKRPAARNWRHLIKLCLALCWLFDVKRFVTRWLLSWFPLRQIRATITSQTRPFNRPTQPQILSGTVLKMP